MSGDDSLRAVFARHRVRLLLAVVLLLLTMLAGSSGSFLYWTMVWADLL